MLGSGLVRVRDRLDVRAGCVLASAVAVLCCVSPAAAAPDASGGQGASSFLVEVSWANVRAQYGRVWSKLHPRYQRVTTREFWESCQRKRDRETSGIEVHSIKPTAEYADRVTLPLLGNLKVRAVTMEMRYSHPLLGSNKKLTDTVYAVRWGSAWKGLWEPETYKAYSRHRCPG